MGVLLVDNYDSFTFNLFQQIAGLGVDVRVVKLLANQKPDFLIEGTPTGSDYAPHLWLDNFVDAGSDGARGPGHPARRIDGCLQQRGAPLEAAFR